MPKIDRIIPLLVYEDIAKAHDFLVNAFGFESGGLQRTPDGSVVHGEVRAGDLVIWLHRVRQSTTSWRRHRFRRPAAAWSFT